MIVQDLVDTCRDRYCEVLLRNEEGFNICQTDINSEGIEPYLKREIIQWFTTKGLSIDICLYLKNKSNE